MSESRTFDASRYLVTLKGKDYLEVKWRLLWLRTEHPEAQLTTELLRLEEGYAVFRATVSIPEGGSATGHGSEEASDFPDFLEKAETKAIGRALGALGYGTQFTEDFEFERGGEQGFVDAPVERLRPQPQRPQPQRPAANGHRAPTATPAAGGEGVTQPQLKAIYAIAKKSRSWTDDQVNTWCVERYGERPSALTKRQASELIDELQGAPA